MGVRRAGGGGRGGGILLVAAVVVLLALAVLAAGTAGPAPRDPGRPLVPGTGSGPAPSVTLDDGTARDVVQGSSNDLLQVEVPVEDLILVGVLVLGALLTLLLRRRRSRGDDGPAAGVGPLLRAGATAAADARPLLDRALAAAEQELAAPRSGEPRDAVVACWLRLEEGAAAAGVRRLPAQTPTEFTTALLGGLLPGEADRRALDDLRALYSRARFGSTPLDADAPARAAAALAAVRAGLLAGGPAPAGLAPQPRPRSGR